jgi:hypothetical protein
MTRQRLPHPLSGLDSSAFAALVERADADYAEGRVAVDADGWIVSETELRLRQTPAARAGSRRGGRSKKQPGA